MKKVTEREVGRICRLIQDYIYENEKIVLGVSGGIDSDVVARLCVKALSPDRVHLFFVVQEGVPEKRCSTVRELADELQCELSIIDLQKMNIELVHKMHRGDMKNLNMDSFMDAHRAKCALRVAIYSLYNENDFIFCSTTNRTELETGACMLWGDMLGHIRPIAHLYKTQVYELARLVGTKENVLSQAPSADFWEGEDDMDDLSYMLLNRKQVTGYRRFSSQEMKEAEKINEQISGKSIDVALEAYSVGKNIKEIEDISGLRKEIVEALGCLIKGAKETRARKILVNLEPID